MEGKVVILRGSFVGARGVFNTHMALGPLGRREVSASGAAGPGYGVWRRGGAWRSAAGTRCAGAKDKTCT